MAKGLMPATRAAQLDQSMPPPDDPEAFQRWSEVQKLLLERDKLLLEREKFALASTRLSRFGPFVVPVLVVLLSGIISLWGLLIQHSVRRLSNQTSQLTSAIGSQRADTKAQLAQLTTKLSQITTRLATITPGSGFTVAPAVAVSPPATVSDDSLVSVNGGSLVSGHNGVWYIKPSDHRVTVTIKLDRAVYGDLVIRGQDKHQIVSAALFGVVDSTGVLESSENNLLPCSIDVSGATCSFSAGAGALKVRFETKSNEPVNLSVQE